MPTSEPAAGPHHTGIPTAAAPVPGSPASEASGLDGSALARWLVAAAEALGGARSEIDDINVFPVADGDTGTNLALTSEAVAGAVLSWARGEPAAAEQPGAGKVAGIAAEAALQGAKGNSGVILAAWLRGFADGVGDRDVLDGSGLAAALTAASDGATSAVGRPLEGTILTVARVAGARAAAHAVRAAPPVQAGEAVGAGANAGAVAVAALEAARDALAGTTAQLPALRSAGVVDAGGAGLVVLLEALAGVPRMAAPSQPPAVPARPPRRPAVAAPEGGPAYEVMYLLDAPAESLPELESALGALGDSLVVSGRPGCYRVHVHVDNVGAAIEAALDVGRPSQIDVVRFADQAGHGGTTPVESASGRVVVAMVHGAGLAPLMAAGGAAAVEGFQLRSPSVPEVVHAIRSSGAGEVIVLPNDAAAAEVAGAAAASARAEGRTVRVVPTRSVMQGLAALAVHDPNRPFDDDVLAMTATARSTRSGEVAIADAAAFTSAGECAAGQALGLIEGDVVLITDDVQSAAVELLHRMLLGGGELVTLIVGARAPEAFGERLMSHLQSGWPAVEVEVHDCGQPGSPLLVGVE